MWKNNNNSSSNIRTIVWWITAAITEGNRRRVLIGSRRWVFFRILFWILIRIVRIIIITRELWLRMTRISSSKNNSKIRSNLSSLLWLMGCNRVRAIFWTSIIYSRGILRIIHRLSLRDLICRNRVLCLWGCLNCSNSWSNSLKFNNNKNYSNNSLIARYIWFTRNRSWWCSLMWIIRIFSG